MGEVPPSGSIRFRGQELVGKKPYEIAQAGIGYVPESAVLYDGLTAWEYVQLLGRLRQLDEDLIDADWRSRYFELQRRSLFAIGYFGKRAAARRGMNQAGEPS